jgi:ArsR family transcriptional regulator, arsenate/arsenite/antimonite-responsive transcriptional repressor
MKKDEIIAALAALAQETRLETVMVLVRAGPEGLPAGAVAAALRVSPGSLSFHFDRLRHAGLVEVRRRGRMKIYAIRSDTVNEILKYLGDMCGGESPLLSGQSDSRQQEKRKSKGRIA